MNLPKSSLLLLLAMTSLATSALSAERFEVSFKSGPPSKPGYVASLIDTTVAPDRSKSEILRKLGEPALKLSPDGWVYTDVVVTSTTQGALPVDTLIVIFNRERVVSMRAVNNGQLPKLIADAKAQAARPKSGVASGE